MCAHETFGTMRFFPRQVRSQQPDERRWNMTSLLSRLSSHARQVCSRNVRYDALRSSCPRQVCSQQPDERRWNMTSLLSRLSSHARQVCSRNVRKENGPSTFELRLSQARVSRRPPAQFQLSRVTRRVGNTPAPRSLLSTLLAWRLLDGRFPLHDAPARLTMVADSCTSWQTRT